MKTKLLSLLVCAAGAITAQAAVGDVVTSLDGISSTTAYTIKVDRGYMPNGDGVDQMYGTTDATAAGKFLIIKVDDFSFEANNVSNYVIYSVDHNKFMTNRSQDTNVYDETPAQALFNISAGNQTNTFIIKSSKTGNWLQFGGSSQFLLTSGWDAQDAGNRWTLTVAEEDVDAGAATEKLNTFMNSYVKSIDQLNNNSTYIIKNVNRAFLNTTATAAAGSRTNYAEVAILKGSKGYYLYDVAHDKFIGTENTTSTEQPIAHYSISYASEGSTNKYNFLLTSSSTNYWLQTDGSAGLTITSPWNALDDGNQWSFTLAGSFDSSAAMEKIANMEADLTVSDPITDLSSLSTSQIYVLKNREYDGYLKGNSNGQRLLYVATGNANLKDPAYHWEIVNVPDEGYVFHNVGTGTYITNLSTVASAGEWRMTNDPVFVYNTLNEYSDDNGNKFFAIGNVDQVGDYAYCHVNGSSVTVNWEPGNPHTQYSISPCGTVDDYAETVKQALFTAATNKITALTSTGLNPEGTDGRIGYLTAESSSNLTAAYDAANAVNATESATIHQKVAEVRNLNSAIAGAAYAHVEAGKYYTIRGAHADHAAKYLTESYTETAELDGVAYNKLVAVQLEANPVSAYWSFNVVEGEGNAAKYHIAAANSGNFMRVSGWVKTCVLLPAEHSEVGVYNYMDKSYRQFGGVNLRCSDGTLTTTDGYSDDHNICSWNGTTDGNNWIIELAESVPVSFNESGYAAVQFPFAVQLPDGVSAYDLSTINDTNEAVTVSRSGNVVPANTPVFLKGETSADLTIVSAATEAAAAETAATLQGTLMPAAVENAFVLSGNQLVPADGNVSANSAYYVSTEGDTTPKTIGGDMTTGINELNADAVVADGAIYDLQGRRVSRAAKGLYIINGKKVLVK